MYKQTLPLFLCILLSACDLIDYHPYDGRLTISERDINGHNIPLIEAATKDKDTIRFVLIGGKHSDKYTFYTLMFDCSFAQRIQSNLNYYE